MASIFSWRGLVQVCECQKTCSDLSLFQAEDVETPAIKQKRHWKQELQWSTCDFEASWVHLVAVFLRVRGGEEEKEKVANFYSEAMENLTLNPLNIA